MVARPFVVYAHLRRAPGVWKLLAFKANQKGLNNHMISCVRTTKESAHLYSWSRKCSTFPYWTRPYLAIQHNKATQPTPCRCSVHRPFVPGPAQLAGLRPKRSGRCSHENGQEPTSKDCAARRSRKRVGCRTHPCPCSVKDMIWLRNPPTPPHTPTEKTKWWSAHFLLWP